VKTVSKMLLLTLRFDLLLFCDLYCQAMFSLIDRMNNCFILMAHVTSKIL